jgi:Flp pilus assembly protein TadG
LLDKYKLLIGVLRQASLEMSSLANRSLIARLAPDRSAVAAVEFALALPVVLLAVLLTVEVGEAVAVSRKVTIATRTVTDLTTKNVSLTTSQMSQILAASSVVLAPFGSSNLVIVVSEVTTDANGKATVTWSQALNGSALTVGSPVAIPSQMAAPNVSMILGTAQYAYSPNLPLNPLGSFKISDQLILMPRLSTSITLTAN